MDEDDLQRIADYAGGTAANLALEVDRLRRAIEQHAREQSGYGTAEDRRLWAVLDE